MQGIYRRSTINSDYSETTNKIKQQNIPNTEIMDYKKSKAPTNTITRNIVELSNETGNIYESVIIMSKRSNQIAAEIKQDLQKKLAEFSSYNDSLEEVFENREQIEISRYYEKLPKPSLLAAEEFEQGQIYWKDPQRENKNEEE